MKSSSLFKGIYARNLYALYTLYIIYHYIFHHSTTLQDSLLLESVLQSPLNGLHVLAGGDIVLTASLSASKRKILGHDVVNIDGIDTGLLKSLSERNNVWGLVELSTLDESASPCKDGGNWIGGGLVALLVLTVVAGDGSVGGLGLEGLSVWSDEDGGHETEGAEALSNDIRLDISIVVWKES